jgi:hypothetical protein
MSKTAEALDISQDALIITHIDWREIPNIYFIAKINGSSSYECTTNTTNSDGASLATGIVNTPTCNKK